MNGPCLSLSPGRRLSLVPWRDVEMPAPAPAGRAGCDPFVNTQGQLCICCTLRLANHRIPHPGPQFWDFCQLCAPSKATSCGGIWPLRTGVSCLLLTCPSWAPSLVLLKLQLHLPGL